MNRDLIFHIELSSEKRIEASAELTIDDEGRIWLEDEPMTVLEARHFWATIEEALGDEVEDFKTKVRIKLADAGTLAAIAAGRHGGAK